MKDNDLRGLVLRAFYDLRKDNGIYRLDEELLGRITNDDYNRIGRQLGDHGLIEWHASLSNDGCGRITASGVDVVEGVGAPSLSIAFNDKYSTMTGSHDIHLTELKKIAQNLNEMKDRFQSSSNGALFLRTDDQAAFVAMVTDAKTLINEALTASNDYVMQLIFTVNNGSGGFWGGPSRACVAEVEQLLQGAVRTIERRQQTKPLEFARAATKAPYVNPMRIFELQRLQGQVWDYSKLIRLCGELNIANEQDCHYAVAMLVRAITDHVAPLFGVSKFNQVVANYKGTKSFKDAMTHLDTGLRKIADSFLHEQIRNRETTPNATQVDFSQTLDLLLAEVIRIV